MQYLMPLFHYQKFSSIHVMQHDHGKSAELTLLQMDGLFFLIFCINNTVNNTTHLCKH